MEREWNNPEFKFLFDNNVLPSFVFAFPRTNQMEVGSKKPNKNSKPTKKQAKK